MTEPALTAEEWRHREYVEYEDDEGQVRFSAEITPDELSLWWNGEVYHLRRRVALAALCLYGQPDGFTREDVELLRDVVAVMPDTGEPLDNKLYLLADRIEALLPPEGA